MKRLLTSLISIALMLMSVCTFGAEVLIWDNDANSTFSAPEGEFTEGCEQAIRRALEANGHSVTIKRTLPNDLSGYDVIFVVLGFYCPG